MNLVWRGTGATREGSAVLKMAAAKLQVVAELQLDDWAVGETEIKIIRDKDGSLCELGHGAFGEILPPDAESCPVWLELSGCCRKCLADTKFALCH